MSNEMENGFENLYSAVSFSGRGSSKGSKNTNRSKKKARATTSWRDWNGDGDSYDEIAAVGGGVALIAGTAALVIPPFFMGSACRIRRPF